MPRARTHFLSAFPLSDEMGEAAAWTAGPTMVRAKAAMAKKVFMFSQAGMLEEN